MKGKNRISDTTENVIRKHKKTKYWQCIASVLAVMVIFGSFYRMIQPAETLEQDHYCGLEEHTHGTECYEDTLICEQEHEHGEDCHTQTLVCTTPEHTHSLTCFSNPEAKETSDIWENSFTGAELGENKATNTLAIARSQLGYTESSINYSVEENDVLKGYTRYGDWAGNAYGDWNGMFVQFCLHYAGADSIPTNADPATWMNQLIEQGKFERAGMHKAEPGDLVFVNTGENTIVGVVSSVTSDETNVVTEVRAIFGDSDNAVAERALDVTDGTIAGYVSLQDKPEIISEEIAEETPVEEEPEPEEALIEEENESEEVNQEVNKAFAEVLAETDLASLTPEELIALLEQGTAEEVMSYLESLSDEEYDELIDSLSEESNEILAGAIASLMMAEPLATGDTYIGFSLAKANYEIDFAMGGGGAGVRKYYLVPYSTYQKYENYGTSNITSIQNTLMNQAEVAYCYNYYKGTPYSRYENKAKGLTVAKYSERENASASLFYNSTAGHARYDNENLLYQKVLAVAMNGYPNDYSGIKATYGLTDDEFRFITQYAIWYYTDSLRLIDSTINTNQGLKNVFYVYADDTQKYLSLDSYGNPGGYSIDNTNVPLAYKALINSYLDYETVNTSHINLYKNIGSSFQNLLTVGREEKTNSLTLKKTVSGTGGDTSQEFTFTIQLLNSSGYTISDTYTVYPSSISGVTPPSITTLTFYYGQATVKLKHGQSITIDGLPDNYRYTITETAASGYTSTVTQGSASQSRNTGDAVVAFNNHKDTPTPTPPPSELKIQVTAEKLIDNGQTEIGTNQFNFRLYGNGVDLEAKNDETGKIVFPEMTITTAGKYTYTIEEIPDERDGTTFDFDKNKKTVTVTVSSHDVQSYDPAAIYYAFEEEIDGDYYYYVDTVAGGKGVVMYCTFQAILGPQDPDGYRKVPVKDQTYQVIVNPTLELIEQNGWVQQNIYGDNLITRLKQLFYYFETDDAKNISNGDKQSLVWTATGKTSAISAISINGKPSSNDATTVLNNIYETVEVPALYNLAFFIPTGKQAVNYPQPLATGYGAVIEYSANTSTFNNTSISTNSLRLSKTVSGGAGDKDQLFNFDISLMDNNFRAISGTFTATGGSEDDVAVPDISEIEFVNGKATVSLKHGQNLTIVGLPDNFYYTINEREWNQDGYVSSLLSGPNNNLSGNGATGAINVDFKNHRDAPPLSYSAEIKAKKTLDGELPADGQFTFILRNEQGTELSRKQNDAQGIVTFPLTITEPGTYKYTVEEFNDGQDGITYDTSVKTVTVTVSSSVLQEIVNGDSFVGSNNGDDFYITVNGTTKLDVYCIDGSAGYPDRNYKKVLDPTTAQLEEQVTANNYGDALSENMRKLLYYFDTHSETAKVGYSALTKVFRQELVWCLTGNPGQQHWSYTSVLNQILAESNPPDSYTVVMFASISTPKAQPVIAGYLPSVEVEYEASSNTVEFENFHAYALPETGGSGTKGYALGGGLLMTGAAFLMCISRLVRKK